MKKYNIQQDLDYKIEGLESLFKERIELDKFGGIGTAYTIIVKCQIPTIRYLRKLLSEGMIAKQIIS